MFTLSRTLTVLLLLVAFCLPEAYAARQGAASASAVQASTAQAASPGKPAQGASRGALALWTPAQLAEPRNAAQVRAERAIRKLAWPDDSAPARTAPVEPVPQLPEARRGVIRRVQLPAGDKRVALTFDLCERAAHVTGYDARLVDALRAGDAKATFFAGGKWLRSHPERGMQLMADPRFELGNHAWTHANMAVAPEQLRKRQLDWTSAQYELLRDELDRRLAARGLAPSGRGPLKLFRLPYGRGGADVSRLLNDRGFAVIQWDVVGEGGSGSAQARAQALADAVRPGSIVLLHANAIPKDTAELVRRLLPLLAGKGYATATVSELLDAGRPNAVEDGYFTLPGDNRIYDDMFTEHGTGARLTGRKRP